jgi:hypothetical protein
MNELYLKLMAQAGLNTEALKQYAGGFPREDLLIAEDLCNLVAQEAIAVVQKRYMGDNNREDMEVRRCVEDLKKHFGIKQ